MICLKVCVFACISQYLYLQVQSCELLPLLPRVAFELLDGPGRLASLPVRQAGESQVRVQGAALHVRLHRGSEGVRRENLLDQVRLFQRLGWAVGLGELILPLSLCLLMKRG